MHTTKIGLSPIGILIASDNDSRRVRRLIFDAWRLVFRGYELIPKGRLLEWIIIKNLKI
jgi:hypothetical protein